MSPAPLFASDPVPVGQAPTDDTIAAARQQLDALKSDTASKPAATAAQAEPSLSLPQLDTSGITGPTITLTPTTDKDAAKKKASKNWLVDGVMKQERADRLDAQDQRPGTGRRGKPDSITESTDNSDDSVNQQAGADDPDTPTKLSARSTDRADRAAQSSSGPKDAPKDPFNPLAQYMASWLAPEDYPLLRHAADTPGTSTLPTDNLPSAAVMPADTSTALTLPGGDLGGADTPRAVTPLQSPADNPFLQFLAPPESPAPVVAPPAQQIIPPPATAPLPPPPETNPSTSTSTVPDFAKPDTDDKYFKPLKRF